MANLAKVSIWGIMFPGFLVVDSSHELDGHIAVAPDLGTGLMDSVQNGFLDCIFIVKVRVVIVVRLGGIYVVWDFGHTSGVMLVSSCELVSL